MPKQSKQPAPRDPILVLRCVNNSALAYELAEIIEVTPDGEYFKVKGEDESVGLCRRGDFIVRRGK